MTGAGFNAVGRQLAAAIKLYVEQHGDTVAGRKIEIILRDDAGVADNARRIIQEMIVNERVGLVGIGITPTSLAIAPLVTEARIPTLVLSSGASVTVTKSPYMVRAGFVIAQQVLRSWPNGRPRTAANARSHWSTIGRRGLKRRPPSERVLSRQAADNRVNTHPACVIRILPPSCSGYAISIRIRRLFISPARSGIFTKQFAERAG